MPAPADLEALRATCRASRDSALEASERIEREVADSKENFPRKGSISGLPFAPVSARTFPHLGTRKNADGSVRYYFKKKGRPLVRLPDDPGSPEFISAYAAALGNFTLPGDDPLSPFFIMMFVALRNGDRNTAENVCVRLFAAFDASPVKSDPRVTDDALRAAIRLVRRRTG